MGECWRQIDHARYEENPVLSVSQFLPLAAIAPVLTVTLPIPAIAATPAVPEPARYLPSNTAYVVMLDMRDETWQQLNQYAFFQILQAQGEPAPNPGGLPYLPAELDYSTEIAPWVGETTAIALLPLGTPRVTVLAEHEVLLAPIAEASAFEGFVETVADLREAVPITQTYDEVSILYWEPVFREEEDAEAPPAFDPANLAPASPALKMTPTSLLKASPEAVPSVEVPTEPEPDVPGLAIAVLPDLLIAAEHPAAIRAWIDLRPDQEAESLAASERFQRTLENPRYDSSLGVFYGSMAEIVKYSLTDFSELDLPFDLPFPEAISPQEVAELASLQLDSTLEVLIYPQPEGIRIQGRGYYDNALLQTLPSLVEPAPPEILNHVPAASYFMVSGHNLADAWQGTAEGLAATEETADFLNQARAFFRVFTGLDLDEEFLGWMDGGFTVFLFPTRQTPLTAFAPELQIGLGIALQTSDRSAAEFALAQLDEQLGRSFSTVETQTINANPATSWALDFNEDGRLDSFLGHSWASDDTLVITTSIGSLSEVLNLSSRAALPRTSLFQRATQGFPTENQGYLYGNVSATLSLINQFTLFAYPTDPEEEEEVDFADLGKALGTVQTLSATLSFDDEYLQLDGLIMMSPAQR